MSEDGSENSVEVIGRHLATIATLTKERDEWKALANEARPLIDDQMDRINSLEEGVRCAMKQLEDGVNDYWITSVHRAIATLKPLINGGVKTIQEVSDEDRLVVMKWVMKCINESGDDPYMMLFETVKKMEKEQKEKDV